MLFKYLQLFPVVLLLVLLSSCQDRETRIFDIPSGVASDTLVAFIEQAEVEIMYNVEEIGVFETSAVTGKMTTLKALDRMLEDTPLQANMDPDTRAFAIVYRPNPK